MKEGEIREKFTISFSPLFTQTRDEFGYNVMKGTEFFVPLSTNVYNTKQYVALVKSKRLFGITRYLAL